MKRLLTLCSTLSCLLFAAAPVAAHGLHPEDMDDCVAAEVGTILDAVAATPGAGGVAPEGLTAAYGESFANCAREEDVSIWQDCFASDSPLQCLTEMADVASVQIPLDKAAARMMQSEHGLAGATDSFAASDAAVAVFAGGIGGDARTNCEANPPEGIAPDLNTQACRILFELGQYATWRGGQMLWDGQRSLPERPAMPSALRVDSACLTAQLPEARETRAGLEGDPSLALGRGGLLFVGCSNALELLRTCFAAGQTLDPCIQSLWRQTRAERIAQALATEAALPAALATAVRITQATEDLLMAPCIEGDNVARLPANTGWALCAVSVDGMQTAILQGMEALEGLR